MRDTSVQESIPLRIISHNIRYATTSPFPGELPWPDRKASLIAQLLYHTRHCAESFICLQEVLHHQLIDILEGLNSVHANEWSYIGVGRDDGKERGEYSPILYRCPTWTLERSFTTWLSLTPWVAGSKGWDAASVRILTTAVFVHTNSGKSVCAMNTHLDDQGSVSRRESAEIVLRTMNGIAVRDGVDAAFLAGDLNSETTGEAYQVLNANDSGMTDMTDISTNELSVYGNEMTFTGFDGHGDGEERTTRIDFVHLSTPRKHDHRDPRSSEFGVSGLDNETIIKLASQMAEETPPEAPTTTGADLEVMPAQQRDQVAPVGADPLTRHFRAHAKKEILQRNGEAKRTTRWEVQGYAVLPNLFDDTVYISDHRAVVGDVLLK